MDDGRPDRPASGWRWSDDVLRYRIRFVSIMAVLAALALAVYLLLGR